MYTGLIINGTIPRGDVWNLFPPQELDPPMGEGCTMLHLYSSGQGPENTRFWGENRILRAEANLETKKTCPLWIVWDAPGRSLQMELWGPYKWPLGLPGAHQQCVLPDVDANKFSGKKNMQSQRKDI